MKQKKSSKSKFKIELSKETVLYIMIGIFVLMAAYFLVPSSYISGYSFLFTVVAVLSLVFAGLGIYLAVISQKEKNILRIFLTFTGISATGPLVFTLLYNLFYAFAVASETMADTYASISVVCFLSALLICPVFFVAGVIASFVAIHKNRK